jgi:flagella basal body P-ring formation protein FlgA
MISSASLFWLALVSSDTTPPPSLAIGVQRLVAAAWQVNVDAVTLSWGRLPTLPDDLDHADLRLGASGRDGWQVVTVIPDSGRTVAIAVRAGTLARRPVATRQLVAGSVIATSDAAWREVIVWGPPAADTAHSPIGWEVRRAVSEGDPLTGNTIRSPQMISAGDQVTFLWQRGTVRMERIATAQSSARLGEVVRAQVGSMRLEGIVVAPDTALLGTSP